jgi:hypothetical protein
MWRITYGGKYFIAGFVTGIALTILASIISSLF